MLSNQPLILNHILTQCSHLRSGLKSELCQQTISFHLQKACLIYLIWHSHNLRRRMKKWRCILMKISNKEFFQILFLI